LGQPPCSIIIPRFVNATEHRSDLLRGYSFQGGATRRGGAMPSARRDWARISSTGCSRPELVDPAGRLAECLPYADNRITLDATKRDRFGLPQTHIRCDYGDNERRLLADALVEAKAMLATMNATILSNGRTRPAWRRRA
jgi:hypothetical protein